MDLTVLQLGLFLSATFAAALVAGVTGFAFALIAAAVWLHILTPLQTVTLTICYGLIVQGYGFWKMRHAFNWEPVLAVHRRQRPRHRDRHPGAALGRSRHHAHGHRRVFGAVFDLWPDAACAEADPGRHRRRHHRRFFQRPARRDGGLSGHHHRDLVHHARLDAGRSARRLSAGQRCAAGDVRRSRSARPDRSRSTRCICSWPGFPRWRSAPGPGSGSTARSTTRCFARSCSGCCWRPACSCWRACCELM